MGALVSGDLVAIVAATPQYEAYVKAKRVFYAAQDSEKKAVDASMTARDARIIAEQDLKLAKDELDVAIEEALR